MENQIYPDVAGIDILECTIYELEEQGRLGQEKEYIQHGTTTVYEHSVRVAYISLLIAHRLKLKVDYKSMIRGALLHDYFLYDWHEKDDSHKLHGFTHAMTSIRNAKKDYNLNWKEKEIIAKHMFPLNIIPPHCKEAWIVCMADKYCATLETLGPLMLWKRWMAG